MAVSRQTVHINCRSNDGRCINLIVPDTCSVSSLRDRIARDLGIPLSSAGAMILLSTNSSRSAISDDLSNVSALATRHGRGPAGRIGILVDNGHLLSPKVAFDICQILKHWSSPAMIQKVAYRTARSNLSDIIGQALANSDAIHSMNAANINRVFGRVNRGHELLKKLGFSVTTSSIRSLTAPDVRLFEVARDQLSSLPTPVTPSTSGRRHSRSLVGLGAASLSRHRRLREFIDMSYEALLRFEDIRVGLDSQLLQSLPLQVMDATALQILIDAEHADCGICLEQFAVGDTIMRLPCLHTYHPTCATTWFAGSKRCPNDMIEVTGDAKTTWDTSVEEV